MLIFYPATLITFSSASQYFYYVFSTYIDRFKYYFTSFPNFIPFDPFLNYIAIANTSGTMLYWVLTIGIFFLFLILMEMYWVFSFSVMLAVSLLYIALTTLSYILVSLGSPGLLSLILVSFCSRSFLHLMKWSFGFYPLFCLYVGLHLLIYTDWTLLHFWNRADLFMVDYLFMYS